MSLPRPFFLVWIWLLTFPFIHTYGQNLSFSSPVNFLPEATTGKAIDITQFKNTHFVTWNDARNGSIHVTWLGKQYADPSDYNDVPISGSQSSFAPVLRATPNYLYVLWIDKDGIKSQLQAGIRMFDLRIGLYNNALYTKHCSSDCMADAIGDGYGEKLSSILYAIKDFLRTNKKETLLLSFSHFCEKEAPAAKVAQYIIDTLGREFLFANEGKKLNDIRLEELAGKVIVVFEQYAGPGKLIDSCSITPASGCFINFRREYAATNILANLQAKEKIFFTAMGKGKLQYNDLIRLDWQLTQSGDEAAMICNDFQSENVNPLINGAMLLTNALRNHHSIKDLSLTGNRSILPQVSQWIADGTINKNNKPNILYVDVAGGWITDYCIQLNDNPLYQK